MEPIFTMLLQVGCAFAASCAFAVAFEIRGKNILFGGIGGAVGWIAYLAFSFIDCNQYMLYFIAGLAISLYSEVFARVRKSPVTVFLIVAFIPLVPGGDAYRTMEYCILGQFSMAVYTGLRMLGIAGSIVLGVFFASTIFRFIYSIFFRNKNRTAHKS